MCWSPGQQRVKLFETRGPAGDDSAVFGLGRRELVGERLADVDAEVVVLGFVAEAPGHSTTLHVGGDNVEPAGLEHRNGVRFEVKRALLTVAVVRDPLAGSVGEDVSVRPVLDESVHV